MVCASAAEPNAAKANAAIHAICLFIVYPLPLAFPAFAESYAAMMCRDISQLGY
jgi:hypothetical protein